MSEQDPAWDKLWQTVYPKITSTRFHKAVIFQPLEQCSSAAISCRRQRNNCLARVHASLGPALSCSTATSDNDCRSEVLTPACQQ